MPKTIERQTNTYVDGLARIRDLEPWWYLRLQSLTGDMGRCFLKRDLVRLRRRNRDLLRWLEENEPEVHETFLRSFKSARRRAR